jgi:hypothetical protein
MFGRNVESRVRFADWCAPVKISIEAVYYVPQALLFQGVNFRRILPGGIAISYLT